MRTDQDAQAMQAALDALRESVPSDCFKQDGRWLRDLGESIGLYGVEEYAEKLEAIAKLEAALAQPAPEPVAWMWQHDETGRIGFVEAWQVENGWQAKNWQAANPRLQLVAPLFRTPPAALEQGIRMGLEAAAKECDIFERGNIYGVKEAANAIRELDPATIAEGKAATERATHQPAQDERALKGEGK